MLVLLALAGGIAAADRTQSFAGSVQLDYLAAPTEAQPRQSTLDGATVEMSLKLNVDFSPSVSASIKVCFACHGFEAGLAMIEMRASDELRLRVGRMTPELGAFPTRHDPANHDTSDKPLPYDMGRMLRLREWNEGVLPAPWVDNGVELVGTHFFAHGQLDYAAYAISGPKGAADATDFDFTLSRSPSEYYVDNNSQPSLGGRLSVTTEVQDTTLAVGASGMAGHYDPAALLGFAIAGADATLQTRHFALRTEYLARWTQMAMGTDPAARFKYGPTPAGQLADYFFKDGFYAEAEWTHGPLGLIARWDGLRRRGNVIASSPLRSESAVLRYTAAAVWRFQSGIRLKASIEAYDFSDFSDAIAAHLGLAASF